MSSNKVVQVSTAKGEPGTVQTEVIQVTELIEGMPLDIPSIVIHGVIQGELDE